MSQESPMLNTLNGNRFIFSLILSFLNECDGTSALITNKQWARHMLPIFTISLEKLHSLAKSSNGTQGLLCSKSNLLKQRHKFIVVPVQDSNVLLDRLNTIKLRKRFKAQRTIRACEYLRAIDKRLSSIKGSTTTLELAWIEWNDSRMNYSSLDEEGRKVGCLTHDEWSAEQDLLRYRTPKYVLNPTPQCSPSQLPPKILSGITAIASYPRSGNTLLRNLLERITNIVTGSDTRPDRTLSKSLALDHNLVGEGITDSQLTPIVKTHFPERRGYKLFNADRIILLVRNPYDAIDSYWNMCCTNTHTESITEDIYTLFAEKFEGLARSEIRTWMEFLKYWLIDKQSNGSGEEELCIGSNNSGPPTLIIQYEDLVLDTQKTMEKVISFLLQEVPHAEEEIHPFWRWRIDHGLGLIQDKSFEGKEEDNEASSQKNRTHIDTNSLGSYKPRIASEDHKSLNGKKENINDKREQKTRTIFGKSLEKNRYSEETLKYMHNIAQEEKYALNVGASGKQYLLSLFGYDIFNQNFPKAFLTREKFDSMMLVSESQMTARVNSGKEIRSQRDPYGRAMTTWRKGQTDGDKHPFPTIKRTCR